jgi:hypothetical protein
MEIQKEYNLGYLLAEVRIIWGKASDSGRTNETKPCRMSSDIESELENHTVEQASTDGEQTQQKSCRTSSDIGSELENNVGRGPM